MSPKHIDNIADPKRRASAPYNFVELPEKVVEAQELPSGDRYHPNKDVEIPRHTGRIECTLTTESPIYTRCGWSPKDFAEHSEKAFKELSEEIKDKRANFFINPATKKQVVPGSSIRGMLRTIVEIVSFSKIDRVSDDQKFFFRSVAAEKSDPLKRVYKLENVQAGYLSFDKNRDKWYVYPALILDEQNNLSYFPVKEVDIKRYIRSLIPMKKDNYLPQYIDISFELDTNNQILISDNVQKYPNPENQGILVTSGNMLETSNLTEAEKETKLKSKKGRKYHYIISKQYSSHQPIEISQEVIFDYISALTNFQNGKFFKDDSNNPFDNELGVLKDGRPIFYCQPTKPDQPITLFGQSPNFRIPYSPQGNGKASTARDFIPHFLKDSPDKPAIIDIAEAIFGFVRRDKQQKKEQNRAGRVFITDGILKQNQEEKLRSCLDDKNSEEILLSSPKPTTFQHYLVQPKETQARQENLKHYASQPAIDTEPGETVIRGHKLYWHKPYKKIEVPENNADTQTSLIKPIDPEIEFTFDIHFENLSDVELGTLLWVLSLSSEKSQTLGTGIPDEKYCFSLGMGKPLGMGAVKIDYELHLSDRAARYSQLFNAYGWSQDKKDHTVQDEKNYVKEFEKFVLDRICCQDYPKDHTREQLQHLKQLPRIEMLLAMLRWDHNPGADKTRYMEIKCDPSQKKCIGQPNKDGKVNEYEKRPVLPTPLDVMDLPDNRRLNNSPPSPSTSGGTGGTSGGFSTTPKPILQNKGKFTQKSQQSQQQQKPRDNFGGGNSGVFARPEKPKS